MRTTDKKVTFNRSFSLIGVDGRFPPGEYLVQTDEELIEHVSFPVWRRVATMIHLPRGGDMQVLVIDPHELERLLTSRPAPSRSTEAPGTSDRARPEGKALSRWDGDGGAPAGGR